MPFPNLTPKLPPAISRCNFTTKNRFEIFQWMFDRKTPGNLICWIHCSISESVTKLPKSERNYHTNQNGSNFETWMQHTVCHKVTLSLKVRYRSIHKYKPKQILYPAWNQIFSFKQVQLISAYGTINPQMSLYLWRELW